MFKRKPVYKQKVQLQDLKWIFCTSVLLVAANGRGYEALGAGRPIFLVSLHEAKTLFWFYLALHPNQIKDLACCLAAVLFEDHLRP